MEPSTEPTDKSIEGSTPTESIEGNLNLAHLILNPEPRLRTNLEDDIIQALKRKDIISERLYQSQEGIHQLEVDLKHAHKVLLETIAAWQEDIRQKKIAERIIDGQTNQS